MKSKKKLIYIVSLISLSISMIIFAFAWLSTLRTEEVEIGGTSLGAYFENGDGSEDNPFEISESKHLYNFAWLQDLGYFDSDEEFYYFRLTADIDLAATPKYQILPPIGIDGKGVGTKGDTANTNIHPFRGSFDGQGFKVKNVIVATSGFESFPDLASTTNAQGERVFNSSFDFGTSIGFFGATAGYDVPDATGTAATSAIKNLILMNPWIRYDKTDTKDNYVGIIAGNANGTIQRVAVTKPKIDASRAHANTVVCDNILLGKVNSKLETDLPHIKEDQSKVNIELNIDQLIQESNFTANSISVQGITYSQKEEMFFPDANGNDIELPGIKIFGEIVLRKRDSKEQGDIVSGGDGNVYDKGAYEFRFPGAPKTSFTYTDAEGNTQLAYDRTIQFTTTGTGTITVKANANSANRQLCLGKVSDYKKDDETTYQVYTITNTYTSNSFVFNIPESGTYQIFAIGGGVDITYFKFNYDDTVNGNSGAGTNENTDNVDVSYIDIVCENNLPVYDRVEKTWSNWNRWQTQMSFTLPENHLLVFQISKNLDLRSDDWVESDDSFEVNVTNRTAIQQIKVFNPYRRVFNFTEGTDNTSLNEIYFKYPVYVDVSVDAVIAKIAALPDPDKLTITDASAVQVAQSMYEALNTIDQGFITNYDKLEACKARISELKINEIIKNVEEIYRNQQGNVVYDIANVDANDGYYIQQARGGYNSLTQEELDMFRDMKPSTSTKTYVQLFNDAEDKFTTLGIIISLSLDTTNVKQYYKESELAAGPNVLNLIVTANYSTGLTKLLEAGDYTYAFSEDKNYVIITVVDTNEGGSTITARYQIYHVESQSVEFQPATATSIDQYSTEFNTNGAAAIFKNYDSNGNYVGSVTVNTGLTFTYYANQTTQSSSTLSQLTGANSGGTTIYYTITLGANVSERYPLTINEVPTYTVTFYVPSNSAHTTFTEVSTQQVRKGGTINPAAITVVKNIEFDSQNYIFAGWYNGESSSCNYLINFKYAQAITGDLNVYAKFELPQNTNHEVVFSQSVDSYFSVTGNVTNINSISYINALKQSKLLSQGLTLNSSSSISFKTEVDAIIEIKLTESGKSIKINGITYTSDSNGVIMVSLNAGSYTISSSESVNLAYVNVIETGVITEYFRVTFDGNATTNQTVVLESEFEDVIQGTSLGIISAPTSVGYMFVGWNTMPNGNGDMIDEYFVPTSDITLYAIWTQAYEITFNNMGYGADIENVLVLPGNNLNIANYQLTQPGYVFRGWYIGTEEKCDYQTIFTSETEINRDLILYANWATPKYESLKGLAIYALDFDVMSQSERFNQASTTDYVMHSSQAGLVDLVNPTSANISRDQNYVRAINGKAELMDSSNNGTQLFLDFGQEYNSNITLEGYLEVTLKNQSNGWEFFQIIGSTDSITKSNIFSLTVDSGLIKYKYGNGTYNFNNNISAGNGVIYRINYIITIGDNQGSIQLNMLDTDGTSVLASTFVEYTKLSVDGIKLATTDATSSVNSTLYVDFVVFTTSEVEKVTVRLDENYAGGSVHEIQVIKDSSLRVGNVPTYERDGYIFKGWYTDSACTNQFTNQIVSDNSLTLYAAWEVIKEYTFIFNTNSDITLDNQISTVVPHLEQLELDGKYFYGWYFDPEFTLKAESGQEVIDDTYDEIVLYARWEREVLINDFTNEQNILSGYQGKFAHLSDTINWNKGMNLYVKHPSSSETVTSVTPYTNSSLTEGNAILVDDNGVATFLDTTDSATYAYFDLGETIKTGLVNGKVNFKITTDNVNSYAFFQIMGYYNDTFGELVSLRTDNTGYLQLRINGNNNNVIDLTNSSQKLLINKDYSYTIEYTIDYNTNTITVGVYLTNSIDKVVYSASYQDTNFGAFTAVAFTSGDGADTPKNVAFDNLLVTATADYIPDQTIVNFYNGSILIGSFEPNEDGLIETWPTDPERTGYNFLGWFDAAGNLVQSTQQFAYSTNLYAKFSIMTYNITFDANDGLFGTGQSTIVLPVEYAETIDPVANPTLSKYVFGGWSLTKRDKDATDAEIEYFDFSNSIVTQDLTLYAVWLNSSYINLEAKGYENALFAEWNDTDAKSENVVVKYRLKGTTEYTTLEDSELIRQYTTQQGSSIARVDILGIKEGTYEIEVTSSTGIIATAENIYVVEYDRSGYAHFGSNEGVGAYNNDGTLKTNAQVIYVSEATKNTVTAEIAGKTYTGLINIISATSTSSNPIAIRFLDTIYADQYAYKDFIPVSGSESSSSGGDFSNVYENKYPQLNGLYNSIKTNATKKVWYTNAQGIQEEVWDTDAVFNMCKVKNIKNLTIEGVGTDAGLCQWGIHFSSSYQIEVRNLTFTDYPEDAVDMEGTTDSAENLSSFKSEEGRFWIHHNTFNSGKNNWDLTGEQDKPLGDGSTDIHKISNITLSYNYYNGSQKTGLIGGDNKVTSANITLAHNYYLNCGERVPLGRQANIHIYNNYYHNTNGADLQGGDGQNVSAINARANSYVYAEYNSFENIRNPFETSYRNGGFTTDNGLGGSRGFVKSYNNYEENCIYYMQTQEENKAYNAAVEFDVSTDTNIQKVDSRTTAHSTVGSSGHKFAPNFDTNSTYFYYNQANQVSDVTYLATEKNVIKSDAKEITGALNHRIRVAGNTCVVSFETNGGTEIKSVAVDRGGKVNQPDVTPERLGYTFGGWYADKECTVEFDFNQEINESTTVYAKWTAVKINVTFVTDGGSAVAAQTLDYGTIITQTSTPNTAGFEFKGWYTEANGQGEKVETVPYATSGITLYAYYDVITYTITFNSNGGSAVNNITANANSTVNKPTDPTMTGYTFAGWYTDSSLQTPVSWPLTLTGNTTLYAKWTINQYTVTWMDGETVVQTGQHDYNTYLSNIMPTDPTAPEGQVFKGWKIDGQDNVIDLATVQITSDMTLIAVYGDPVSINVDYTNPTSNTSPNPDVLQLVGLDAVASVNVDGYTSVVKTGGATKDNRYIMIILPVDCDVFIAMRTGSNGNERSIFISTTLSSNISDAIAGTIISNSNTSSMSSNTVTLPAGTYYINFTANVQIASIKITQTGSGGGEVTPNEYTVTLDANGGTVTPTSITVTEGVQIGSLPTPTRAADSSYTYTFAGWFDTANETGGTQITSSSTFTANTTIFARWNKTAISGPSSYTVTLNANGGTVTPTSITVTEGVQIGTLPTPTRAADGSYTYTFAGWFDTANETGGNEITSSSTFTANTTIYARWNKTAVGGGSTQTFTWDYTTDGAGSSGDMFYFNGGTLSNQSTGAKPNKNAQQCIINVTQEATVTVVIYNNNKSGRTITIGAGSAQSISSTSGNYTFTGTINSSNNKIVFSGDNIFWVSITVTYN